MIYIATYDTHSGKILARYRIRDEAQLVNYPNAIRIPESVFNDEPERKKKVSVSHVQLPGGPRRAAPSELVDKVEVTVTPEAATFPADGSILEINFSGLSVNGHVRIGSTRLPITVADPVYELTSDVVRDFLIYMDDDVHWSEPVTVRAV